MINVIAYTDGACSGNPGPGGWGAYLNINGEELDLYGGEKATTNNRMELMAAIKVLEHFTTPTAITIFTDSTYVQKGITEWIAGWKRKNWMTAAKKPVKNVDLWQRLEAAATTHQVDWKWVKGHAGDPGNERADELARQGIPS